MRKEISLTQFVLLLFELMFFLMLVSNGGMSIYSPEQDGVMIEDINREFLENFLEKKRIKEEKKEYLELPYWWSNILISKDNVKANLQNTKSGELVVLYVKLSIIFVAFSWLLFILIRYTTFKSKGLDSLIFAVFKILLFFFFLGIGFIYIAGNISPTIFWEYGNLTMLPSLSSYIALRNIPMLLTLVLGSINLIAIKFGAKPSTPPPKPPEHKLHH